MTPTQRPRPHLAPTSPQRAGRPQHSTSPLSPLPVGGDVELESPRATPTNTTHLAPRGDLKGEVTP